MKQGDYVKWIYGPNNEKAVAKGTILKRIPDGRFAVMLHRVEGLYSIQHFKETELRIIQATE